MQTVKQEFGRIETNPIGLEPKVSSKIVEALNMDLAGSYVMYLQFKKHHWIVVGPEWKQLHLALDEYASGVLKYADMIAERINLLGGIPISAPSDLEKFGAVKHEGEERLDLRTMLYNDVKNEQAFIAKLRKHIKLAKELGDYGTEELLEDALRVHEENTHELDNFLVRESLTVTNTS